MSNANARGRNALEAWQKAIQQNIYQIDEDFKHSIHFYFPENSSLDQELTVFAEKIAELDCLVMENNLASNLPRIEPYNGIGQKIERIIHHPTYEAAGNLVYSSRILERMSKVGGLLEALAFMFLSSQAGEAGHNCPIACSAGMIRVLQKIDSFPHKQFYLDQLMIPSYTKNYTGAQFLTEIQGGSDVGLNAVEAHQDEQGYWRITGEKWFCSNADAELILLTARFDKKLSGTKGLGLFLVPAYLETGERNEYTLRRLKDKIGTRSMASAEIDFQKALAFAVGKPEQGFKMVMENVLHISRLFNTFCVLGMSRRAFHIALAYAQHRIAFEHPIISFPLIKENLARIKAENTALLASIFATVRLQDLLDAHSSQKEEDKLLLRLLANLNKYLSALWSVEHIHHSLDVLAGNGAIESFSILPRLLRDCIVCENWEGTHNTLRMQILKDILRYQIDDLYINHLESLLSEISSSHHLEVIQQALAELKNELKILKQSNFELQSLQIKKIVDQMAIIYAAIHLTREGLDQKHFNKTSKQCCLDYFILLHLKRGCLTLDSNYLDLINSILPQ